jgi:UDP-N-acetylmuramoylalanine--D-glutamate ligase
VHWPQGAAQHLQGQRVLILGLGISGIAMARWCVRAGAEVTVADTREAPYLPALQAELPGVRFVAGEFTAALVDGQSLSSVYRSPGLSPASVAPVFNAARSIGLPTAASWTCLPLRSRACAKPMAMRPRCWASPAPMARPRSPR